MCTGSGRFWACFGCPLGCFIRYQHPCFAAYHNKKQTMFTTSTQNFCFKPTPLCIFPTFFINVMFILFVTPFFCVVYGVVFCLTIPLFLQNCSNFAEQDSPSLPILKTYIFFFNWFSARALNFLNLLKLQLLLEKMPMLS